MDRQTDRQTRERQDGWAASVTEKTTCKIKAGLSECSFPNGLLRNMRLLERMKCS